MQNSTTSSNRNPEELGYTTIEKTTMVAPCKRSSDRAIATEGDLVVFFFLAVCVID